MAFGIEVTNNYNTLLFNERDPSLAVLHKRTLSVSGGYATTAFTGVETPIIAIRSSATVFAVTRHRSGSNLTVTLRTSPSSASVTLYIFDRPQPTSGDFGVQILDASGRVTFDFGRQYGRVVAVDPPAGDWIGDSGRVYAGAILSQRWLHQFENTGQPGIFDHYYYSCAVRSISNGLWTSPLFAYQVSPESHPVRPNNYHRGSDTPLMMILDVTGY